MEFTAVETQAYKMLSHNVLIREIGYAADSPAPRVSIITPVYNSAIYIAETLDSILAQTFDDYEIILVNDGSKDTDELEKVLLPYSESIIYIKQENCGASAARNIAINTARGELLAFLDSDDQWLPSYLLKQVNFLDENNFDMVYCDAYLFGENLSGNETYMRKADSLGKVTPESLISSTCNVITSGTIVVGRLIHDAGLFDPDNKGAFEDFDMWFNLAKRGASIGYQKKALLNYRVRHDSYSGSNIQRAERSISALQWIANKYVLTTSEEEAWRKQLNEGEAALELERAKLLVVQKEYGEARRHLVTANIHYRKYKLTILGFLLKVCPVLVREIFRTVKPVEYSFVSAGNYSNSKN